MSFIKITPVYLNPHTNQYVPSEQTVLINTSSISRIYTPNPKYNEKHFTIWFKQESHQDCIRTFDNVEEKLLLCRA